MADNKQKWQEATHEILSKLDIAAEYRSMGLDVTGKKPSSKGWLEARSFGVEDRTPSAGINVAPGPFLGRYKDFRSGETLSLFDFAAQKAGKFGGDWREARNHYARTAGVKLPSGAEEITADRFEFSDLTAGTMLTYARGKPGTSARAIRECGGRAARWPRNLSAEKTNYLIAFPMYGSALLDLEPVAWHCVPQNPRSKIRQFQGKGHEDRLLDKMTAGEHGLMNVDGLARLAEADVVHLVEGITDLLACQTVLAEWRDADPENRKHVVLSAGACTYHPKPEWMHHFGGKDVRLWFDVGDPKNEGQVAAAVWVNALLPVAREVRNVQLPLGPDGGKNDLRAWLNDGHNYQDMLDYSVLLTPIDPADTDSQIAPHEAVVKSLGLLIIGEHEDRSAVEVFCEHTRKSRTIQDVDRLSIVKLIQLCGPEVVEKYVHDGKECPPGKFDLKTIQKSIAAGASDKRFRDDELFGAGVWEADGCLLLVQEQEVGILNGTGKIDRSNVPYFNGRVLDTGGASETWCDFAALSRYLAESEKPQFCNDVIVETNELFSKWYWKQPSAPLVLAGLVCCTWLQTVWHWRPQIFITGASDCGKSMFLDDVLSSAIFGKLSMYVQKVSEAAISQHMRHHARVLIVDEFEADKHRQKIFELFRTSSRGGKKIRGTADQRGTSYRLRHLPWFAAIESGLKSQADCNRFMIFELDKVPADRRGKIEIPDNTYLNDLGMKLLAVALRCYEPTRQLTTKLRSTQVPGAPGRVVESFSLPCALLSVVQNYSEERARDFLAEVLKDWDFGIQSSTDEVELLQAILTSEVRMDGGELSSVSEILSRPEAPDTVNTLARVGIRRVEKRGNAGSHRIVDQVVLFVCPDVVLRTILQRTEYEGKRIDQLLLRLPETRRSQQRLGGKQRFSGIEIPMETIDRTFNSGEDDGAPRDK